MHTSTLAVTKRFRCRTYQTLFDYKQTVASFDSDAFASTCDASDVKMQTWVLSLLPCRLEVGRMHYCRFPSRWHLEYSPSAACYENHVQLASRKPHTRLSSRYAATCPHCSSNTRISIALQHRSGLQLQVAPAL